VTDPTPAPSRMTLVMECPKCQRRYERHEPLGIVMPRCESGACTYAPLVVIVDESRGIRHSQGDSVSLTAPDYCPHVDESRGIRRTCVRERGHRGDHWTVVCPPEAGLPTAADAADAAERATILNSVTEHEAMLVAVLATDAFVELPTDRLTFDTRAGILLLYHAVLAKVRGRLPFKPELAHVFTAIAQAEEVVALVKARIAEEGR
jgi:hypothetical protein